MLLTAPNSSEKERLDAAPPRACDSLAARFESAAFYAALSTIALAAIPHGAVEQWSRAAVVCLICCAALLRLAAAVLRGGFGVREPALFVPLVGLVLLAGVQTLPLLGEHRTISYDSYATTAFILELAAYTVAFEILLRFADRAKRLQILVVFVLATVALSAAFGAVMKVLAGAEGISLPDYLKRGSGFGQFLNRNHFVFLMEMGFGLLLGLLLRSRISRGYKFFGAALGGLLVLTGIAVNSRGGIISLGGILVTAFFFHFATRRPDSDERPRRQRASGRRLWPQLVRATCAAALVFALFVLMIAFVGSDAAVNRIEEIQGEVKSFESEEFGRAFIWRATIELIEDHPLAGVGFGAYGAAITRYDGSGGDFPLQQAHNDYLEIPAGGGVLACLLVVWFGWLVARRIAARLRGADAFRRATAFGATLGLIGVLIHSAVDFGLHVPFIALVSIVLLVLATANEKDDAAPPTPRVWPAAAAYLLVVVIVGYAAARQGLAAYYADAARTGNSLAAAQRALAADAGNSEAYLIAARLLDDAQDYRQAARMLDEGVRRQPFDYRLWLRLGDVRARAGDRDGARAAYEKSLALAPEYSKPNLHLGRLLLGAGDAEAAFARLGKAAARDAKLYPEVLESARARLGRDGAAIERALAPISPKDRRIVTLYLIEHDLVTESAREFMLADARTRTEKEEYVAALLAARNFRFAREVWASIGDRRGMLERAPGELILDGGFERLTENDETAIAWRVETRLADASVTLDETKGAGGSRRSLLISLKGRTDFASRLIAQRVPVEPGENYQLRFDLNSSPIVSNGGLAVFITDAVTNQLLGQSMPFRATGEKWETHQFDFRAGDSAAVFVFVQRLPCPDSPCPIFAETSLDNFSLRKNGR